MAQETHGKKVFNDPVHGHIELHPLLVQVIDTPQFQRLRYIKQLGGCYYVFPGASHNRFEHSIGVCYLAGELVEMLKREQPELKISKEEVLCVKLAGLCHDLGHGPFSHLFQDFIRDSAKDGQDGKKKNWKYVHASIHMFRHLITNDGNKLKKAMKVYDLEDEHLNLIERLIYGKRKRPENVPKCEYWSKQMYDTTGKDFLFEIVANQKTGIDVDRWDYFARDCHYLGLPNNFDIKRYMHFARVLECPGDSEHVKEKRICTRDKEVSNLYEMFHTHATLQRRAYQHKTTKAIELMIRDAMILANGEFKMTEAIDDPIEYTELTDYQVLQKIRFSKEPNLKEAREILEKVEKRELYKCIGYFILTEAKQKELQQQQQQEHVKKFVNDLETALKQKTDMVVAVAKFSYGKGSKDPLKEMYYYKKDERDTAISLLKHQLPQMLPATFMEQHVRVYCKKKEIPEWSSIKEDCRAKGFEFTTY